MYCTACSDRIVQSLNLTDLAGPMAPSAGLSPAGEGGKDREAIFGAGGKSSAIQLARLVAPADQRTGIPVLPPSAARWRQIVSSISG